ncbi:MAG: excinuclease subunit [Chthoniobacter sp.]|jgi:excinuclease ABC subunit C|nr:excinuclease subunit [Chthoniobacter sp.]
MPATRPDPKLKLRDVPHKPGVYLMRDRFNRVIYVGKARNLRKRVSQYFTPSRIMRADLKTRALLDSIWDFEWHIVPSEPEALLLEGRLIKEFRPRYNVSFRDDKRFLLVKCELRDAWPRFRLTRMKTDENARYFGPFAHSGALRQTLAFMRKKFGVLTFGRGNPTERELKSSTYQVPMKLAEATVEQYRERVERACEFLEGRSKESLAELELQMHAAAAKLDFERAAELRNILDDLRKTTKPMARYTRDQRNRLGSTRSLEAGADLAALADALQLGAPPRRMECFDISNISTTHVVASMVCFLDGRPANAQYRRYRIRTVTGQDDFASMAEVVRRRYSRVLLEAAAAADGKWQMADGKGDVADAAVDFSPEYTQESPPEAVERLSTINPQLSTPLVRLPDLIIVDGGKGQLSSACRELQRLGLHEVPIIGLAKEFEEIHRPGRPLPLRLPQDSNALKLLQRIRDEAHRFANGYHQLLMKRRIAESLLDDCPGVSQHRKQILLQHFGSVARIKRASVEDIASVEGIGRRLAEQIAAFLIERA